MSDNEAINENKTKQDSENNNSEKMHNYKYGDIIRFGTINGLTIEWQVINVRDNKVLILSRKGLEARVYNSGSEPVAWETSTIRRYLNSEFLSSCFDAREQGKICDSEIRNTGKNNTIDKLFLLSLEEAESMFNSDEERKCAVSE